MLEFSRKFYPFYSQKARFKIANGGRSGGKSHNIAIALLLIGKDKKKLIVCLREYQKNLEDSVYRLLCNKIMASKALRNHYTIKADRIIGRNGTEFLFSGIKNAKNFKSFEGADIVWVEEGQTISNESWMILTPTIRKFQSEIWITYNPDSDNDPVHKQFNNITELTEEQLKQLGFDVWQLNLTINYYDNPLCPEISKIDAENLKANDYELYLHVWEGKTRTASDAVVFKNKFEVKEFAIEDYFGIPRMDGKELSMRYGLDFGWVHPTAIVECFEHDGYIFVHDEIVGKELDIDDITIRYYNEFKFNKTEIVYGDSARPDLIEQLKCPRLSKQGAPLNSMNIQPAIKGAGSVESGITWMKTHKKIIIHPRCTHTKSNFEKYSYKKDKGDIITTSVLKIHDDCIDAIRYAFTADINATNYSKIDWGDADFQREILLPEGISLV